MKTLKSNLFGVAVTFASVLLLLSSCKKAEQSLPVDKLDLTTKSAANALLLVEANPNADAAFNSFNSSFLVSSGTTQYYKEALNVSGKDYFWRQALDIQMVEDVYLRTQSSAHRTLITNMLNTFLQQNQGSGGLYDWNWNDFNDAETRNRG